MKNSHIIASLALKWCSHFRIAEGDFYQQFFSMISGLKRWGKCEMVFLMYKHRQREGKNTLVDEFINASDKCSPASYFLAYLAAFSLMEGGNFEIVFDVFKAFHAKIGSRRVLAKFTSRAGEGFGESLRGALIEKYSGKVAVETSVDDELIDGWVVYDDFLKIDHSLSGRIDKVFSVLAI